jgi:hypothetical protein
LNGFEFLQHCPRRQARSQSVQPAVQSHVQAVGHEGDEIEADREGRYLLRSNLLGADPARLWEMYIQLTQIEEAFRNLKGDLAIRPIYPPGGVNASGASRKTLTQVVECAMANWQQIVASAELAPHTGAPQKGNKAFE